ncbi:LysR family transcriptional regulator [Serratia liquefaciens]|uniref:helix-turn-helix domain-containing protein n=1 Tax=Serratia liquefaciens TaxID=614 RepID=UPI0032DF7920
MFTSRELNTFICVAEERSVKKAAERLNITAPAVSCMIKKLEERLNLNLFNYSNLSMEMTNCGQAIYDSVSVYYHALRGIETSLMSGKSKHIMVYLSKDFYFLECTIKHFMASIGYATTITKKRMSTIIYDIEICRSNTPQEKNGVNFDFIILSNGSNSNTLTMEKSINKTSYFGSLMNKVDKLGFVQCMFTDSVNEQLEILNSGMSNIAIPKAGVLSQLVSDSFTRKCLMTISGKVTINSSKSNISESTHTALMSALTMGTSL